MVGTFTKIDYRLRPAKHAERSMLIDLFKRLRFAPVESYQYVGFGSVAFVDFRMVHRSLGIRKLISIEAAEDPVEQERFARNKPFGSIDLHFGHSNAVLPKLDFKCRSLVWLDYDNSATRSMANDISTVARDAHSGTFIGFTFTNQFPLAVKQAEKAWGWLRDGFPEYVPAGSKPLDFQGAKYAEFVRSTFSDLLGKTLEDADAGKADPLDHRRAVQVCFIKYKDGVEMATVGWLIVAVRDVSRLDDCALAALPFHTPGKQPFRVDMPKVTPLEIREMELRLPAPEASVELSWLPENERRIFARNYRYLPNFAPVEAV